MMGGVKIALISVLAAVLLGCAGMAHVDLPPKVVWPPTGSAPAPEPPGPDPTRPLNLPERNF